MKPSHAATIMTLVATGLSAAHLHAQQEDAVDAGRAQVLAAATLDAMGGEDAWNNTRYLVWENFGERHYWDKWTGDFRWEEDSLTAVLNVSTMDGRFWISGEEVEDEAELAERLDHVYARWVNNSYWLIMPYKLLDPGVNLRYVGEEASASGQMADVIEMTFEGVGLTPDNRYLVFIDKETGLVCEWTYWRSRDDEEPRFTRPWTDWERYGEIMLSTGRGDERLDIAYIDLPAELPAGIFSDLSY